MNDAILLSVVGLCTVAICSTLVFGLRVIGRKIDDSKNALAIFVKIEFEFLRLAFELEDEIGKLYLTHYKFIEGWPVERMSEAIREENELYQSQRSTLINEYEARFKALDERCGTLYPNYIQELIEMHADSYPSLGLITPSI